MKVTVRVHDAPEVVAQFRAWRRTLAGTRGDQVRWGRFYLECLGKAVKSGIAPEPVLRGDDGDLIRWEFLKGVEFTLLRRKLSRHDMELVVMGVRFDQPRQGAP